MCCDKCAFKIMQGQRDEGRRLFEGCQAEWPLQDAPGLLCNTSAREAWVHSQMAATRQGDVPGLKEAVVEGKPELTEGL